MKTFKIENKSKIKSGFTTPDNYFDQFSIKILQQIQKEEPKVISIFARRKSWIYTAAAILILALTIPICLYYHNLSTEIDETTLENYITNHSTISDEDLANLLDEKDIQKIKIDLNIDDKSIENELSKNTNLEQYLLN